MPVSVFTLGISMGCQWHLLNPHPQVCLFSVFPWAALRSWGSDGKLVKMYTVRTRALQCLFSKGNLHCKTYLKKSLSSFTGGALVINEGRMIGTGTPIRAISLPSCPGYFASYRTGEEEKGTVYKETYLLLLDSMQTLSPKLSS